MNRYRRALFLHLARRYHPTSACRTARSCPGTFRRRRRGGRAGKSHHQYHEHGAKVWQDDWDASEDEKPKASATAAAAPAKKKMTLKQKLAEKERLAAEAKANGDDDDLIETTTEQERRRMAREREIEADLATAADLMGSTGLEDSALTAGIVEAGKLTRSCRFDQDALDRQTEYQE